MDPLSDALRAVRASDGAFVDARLAAPWSFRSPPAEELGAALGIRADCVMALHVLAEGRCWLTVGDDAPLPLECGTIVALPHGHAHVLASRPGLAPVPLDVLLERARGDGVRRASYGHGGETCRFVLCYLACDAHLNPLLGAMPTVLLACPRRAASRAEHSDDTRLCTMLEYIAHDADDQRPGGAAVLARRVELLYLELLRNYAWRLPASRAGWLAAVRHPEVGRALHLLHRDPQRAWSVAELAREVRLSRSALGQRFTEVVGEAPMHYLAGWRIELAKQLLRQPGLSIARVSARVGYRSTVGFHRAFKRRVGETPAAWRAAAS